MSRIKRVPLTRASAELTSLVANEHAQPFVLTQRGKPVAIVCRYFDEDALDHIAWANSPRLREIIAQSEAEIRAGKGIPHDEFWKLVEADSRTTKPKRTRKPVKAKVKT